MREKVVGTYENKKGENTYKDVLLESGIAEVYINGEKITESKWKIVKEELHITYQSFTVFGAMTYIYRKNKESSITAIASIYKDGKRTDHPKSWQSTFNKIK